MVSGRCAVLKCYSGVCSLGGEETVMLFMEEEALHAWGAAIMTPLKSHYQAYWLVMPTCPSIHTDTQTPTHTKTENKKIAYRRIIHAQTNLYRYHFHVNQPRDTTQHARYRLSSSIHSLLRTHMGKWHTVLACSHSAGDIHKLTYTHFKIYGHFQPLMWSCHFVPRENCFN